VSILGWACGRVAGQPTPSLQTIQYALAVGVFEEGPEFIALDNGERAVAELAWKTRAQCEVVAGFVAGDGGGLGDGGAWSLDGRVSALLDAARDERNGRSRALTLPALKEGWVPPSPARGEGLEIGAACWKRG